ncbi:13788_t:CDS:2, partial [Cetraspora pellucida]
RMELFDISQAMSFLQRIKLLPHITPTVISITPYSANSGMILNDTLQDNDSTNNHSNVANFKNQDQATASLMQESTLLIKKDAEIRDVVRNDRAYFLLWVFEEILGKENCILDITRKEMLTDETRKNISTLLEGFLACYKRAPSHDDACTMYLWSVREKLWTLTGTFP